MLNRESLLSAIRGPVKIVSVPELGGDVGIRRLSAADLIRIRAAVPAEDQRTPSTDLDLSLTLLSLALCDADGEPLCSVQELQVWDGTRRDVLMRLVNEAQTHNGMLESQREGLEKNSESGPTSEFM